jgi:hypothetical protein
MPELSNKFDLYDPFMSPQEYAQELEARAAELRSTVIEIGSEGEVTVDAGAHDPTREVDTEQIQNGDDNVDPEAKAEAERLDAETEEDVEETTDGEDKVLTTCGPDGDTPAEDDEAEPPTTFVDVDPEPNESDDSKVEEQPYTTVRFVGTGIDHDLEDVADELDRELEKESRDTQQPEQVPVQAPAPVVEAPKAPTAPVVEAPKAEVDAIQPEQGPETDTSRTLGGIATTGVTETTPVAPDQTPTAADQTPPAADQQTPSAVEQAGVTDTSPAAEATQTPTPAAADTPPPATAETNTGVVGETHGETAEVIEVNLQGTGAAEQPPSPADTSLPVEAPAPVVEADAVITREETGPRLGGPSGEADGARGQEAPETVAVSGADVQTAPADVPASPFADAAPDVIRPADAAPAVAEQPAVVPTTEVAADRVTGLEADTAAAEGADDGGYVAPEGDAEGAEGDREAADEGDGLLADAEPGVAPAEGGPAANPAAPTAGPATATPTE